MFYKLIHRDHVSICDHYINSAVAADDLEKIFVLCERREYLLACLARGLAHKDLVLFPLGAVVAHSDDRARVITYPIDHHPYRVKLVYACILRVNEGKLGERDACDVNVRCRIVGVFYGMLIILGNIHDRLAYELDAADKILYRIVKSFGRVGIYHYTFVDDRNSIVKVSAKARARALGRVLTRHSDKHLKLAVVGVALVCLYHRVISYMVIRLGVGIHQLVIYEV